MELNTSPTKPATKHNVGHKIAWNVTRDECASACHEAGSVDRPEVVVASLETGVASEEYGLVL